MTEREQATTPSLYWREINEEEIEEKSDFEEHNTHNYPASGVKP